MLKCINIVFSVLFKMSKLEVKLVDFYSSFSWWQENVPTDLL